MQSRAPVNFFDIHQISSSLLLPFSPGLLPDSLINQLPVMPDSLRFRVSINRLDVVDAWGTLSIPGGPFAVLREKRTEYRESRLDAKVPPLGWLDITDVAIQYLNLSSLGVDTSTAYHFLNGQSKEAIAICTLDNGGQQVLNVQYKNLDIATGLRDLGPLSMDLSVFPNPAGGLIHIRANKLKPGNYTLVIYNITGAEVWRKTFPVAGNQLEQELDVAHFEMGAYICQSSRDGDAVGERGLVIFVKQ